MIRKIIYICLILRIFYAADEDNKIKRIIPLGGEKYVEVDINFGAGKLVLTRSDNTYLFDGEFKYIDKEPEIDYYKKNGTGILKLGMDSDNGKDKDDLNLTFDSIDDLSENEWILKMCENIPLSLKMELGAANATLNFGKLSVSNLQIESGASKINMNFSEPNPVVMDKLKIEAGVTRFKGYNLLNANFNQMNFEGGIGDYELYFDGKIEKVMNASIDVALGALKLYIPKQVAFCIYHDKSIFSSFEIDADYKKEGDYWYSNNFDQNKPYINFEINAGFGSISVILLNE